MKWQVDDARSTGTDLIRDGKIQLSFIYGINCNGEVRQHGKSKAYEVQSVRVLSYILRENIWYAYEGRGS